MLSLSPQVSLFFMTKSASKPATTFFYVSLLFNVCLCLSNFTAPGSTHWRGWGWGGVVFQTSYQSRDKAVAGAGGVL